MDAAKPIARLFALTLAAWLGCAASASGAPRVRVGETEFRGIATAGGAAAFLGIPYAQPPIRSLRWAPPLPWQPDAQARDATRFAPACMQNMRMVDWYRDLVREFGGDPAVVAVPRLDEDCLYLNVWTPSPHPAERLPVLVWIHGGSNTGGWSYEPNYLGETLARNGLVVVGVAYRLGVFGFFSIPELQQSNFGLLDQIAALAWVRTHIDAFGGDPARITVAGESAGASDIAHLIAVPRARALFARAIMQSGGYSLHSRTTRAQRFARGLALARTLGARTDAQALAVLRAAPATRVLQAVDQAGLTDFDPVVDGDTVPLPAREAIANGARVDLLIGSNGDEWRSYLEPPYDEQAWLREHAPGHEQLLRNALGAERDPVRRLDLLQSAYNFVCPSLWLAAEVAARGAPAWVYHFTRVREGAAAARIGAYHGAEIPYLFGSHDVWLPTAAADRDLGARMMRYWSRFAASGDPNGAGDPEWPRYRPDAPRVMRLDTESRGIDAHPSAALCSALAP